MNDEIIHIAQWEELKARALRFGLRTNWDSKGFSLHRERTLLGKFTTLADLRAAISDNVAARRAAGERI